MRIGMPYSLLSIHYKWRQGLPGRVKPTISWTHQLGDHGLSMGQVLALRPDPGLIRRLVCNKSRASRKGMENVVFVYAHGYAILSFEYNTTNGDKAYLAG